MSIHLTRGRVVAVTAAVTAALLLAACNGTANSDSDSDGDSSGDSDAAYEVSTSTPEPTGDIDSFTWSLYAEPLSLAYPYAFDYPPNTVLSNVCESLLRWNADLSISPGLASAFDNPDPTTWVYTIRDGVTFHDGSPLTADDVVASLQPAPQPAGRLVLGERLPQREVHREDRRHGGHGQAHPARLDVQPVHGGVAGHDRVGGVPGAGRRRLRQPEHRRQLHRPVPVRQWTSGQSITLKRYDDYWDADLKAKSGEVTFVFQQDPNTRVNAWQDGEVDGGWFVPSNAYEQLKNSGPGKLYYGLNTTVVSQIVSNLKGPLGDPEVRKALLMATDREGIIKAGEAGVAEVSDALVSKSTWGGVSDRRGRRDLRRAADVRVRRGRRPSSWRPTPASTARRS